MRNIMAFLTTKHFSLETRGIKKELLKNIGGEAADMHNIKAFLITGFALLQDIFLLRQFVITISRHKKGVVKKILAAKPPICVI